MKFTAEQYVDDVLNGEQVACRYVRLACQRHRDDMLHAAERGLYFDEPAAKLAIAFFQMLKHYKGEWGGQPIRLEPWQQFVLWSLFGWKRADGTRRFRTAYLEVARKNGKTLLAAGIGLYLMLLDGEPGAEVYAAATKRDQAKIAHGDATQMVRNSPHLQQKISVFRDNLHVVDTASKFEPLSADYNSLDGLNGHGIIADELHAWSGDKLWGVLKTSMSARRQPLMLAITTAGIDAQSICYTQRDYVARILTGVIEDDAYFGIIYTLDVKRDWPELDADDNWQDEANWVKANPNIGVSKKWSAMRSAAREATNKPSELNNFLRWDVNVWVSGASRWMSPADWSACQADLPQLAGRQCYGGLDLSSTTDITALKWIFPPTEPDEPYYILCRFWIPADNMFEREKNDGVPYVTWQRAGLLEATPGNVVDYDYILAQIKRDLDLYDVQELAFDRWGSQKIVVDLQEAGFTIDPSVANGSDKPLLVQFGQGFASMSGPMKELEKLIKSRKVAHDGNPVLSWMMDNVVAAYDPAGNVKPDKSKSKEKIDGVVALIMGLARAIAHGGVQESVYSKRGLRTL